MASASVSFWIFTSCLLAAQTLQVNACKTDLLLIIDNSGSVEKEFEQEKNAAIESIGSLAIADGSDAVALIQFNADAKEVFGFRGNAGGSKEQIQATVRNITQVGGITNTASALQQGAQTLRQGRTSDPNVAQVVVIITDGNSQNTWASLIDATKAIASQGAILIGATASDSIGPEELRFYAAFDYSHLFLKNNITQLPSLIRSISGGQQCKGNGLDGNDKTTAKPAEQASPAPKTNTVIDPTPKAVDKQTVAPETKTNRPAGSGGCKTDLLLIVDNSGSVEKQFEQEKNAASDSIGSLNLGGDDDAVALIEFNADAKEAFGFRNNAGTKEQIQAIVRNITQIGGITNTASALQQAAQTLRQGRQSDPNVAQIVVIITDGHSQNTWKSLTDGSKALLDQGAILAAATASDDIGPEELIFYAGFDYSHLFLKNNLTQLAPFVRSVSNRQSCKGNTDSTKQPTIPEVKPSEKPPQPQTTRENVPVENVKTSSRPKVSEEIDPSPKTNVPEQKYTTQATTRGIDKRTVPTSDANTFKPSYTVPPTVANLLSSSGTCQCTCAPTTPKTAEVVDDSNAKNNLLIILDNTGSVMGDFAAELELAAQLVEQGTGTGSTVSTRTALIQFNDHATTVFKYAEHASRTVVAAAIRQIEPIGGNTNTLEALNLAYDEFQQADQKLNKVVLLITDGHSFNKLEELEAAVAKLVGLKATIFVATSSSDVDKTEFEVYSDHHPERVFFKSNSTQAVSAISNYLKTIGGQRHRKH